MHNLIKFRNSVAALERLGRSQPLTESERANSLVEKFMGIIYSPQEANVKLGIVRTARNPERL